MSLQKSVAGLRDDYDGGDGEDDDGDYESEMTNFVERQHVLLTA